MNFAEYTVEIQSLGLLTIIAPEGEPGYRVRLPNGQVTAYPAISGEPSEVNAASDIAYALANPPPAPVPQEVTPLQMRLALNAAGLRSTVESAVAVADQETKDAWEFASTIRRDNALLAGMAAALGLTSAQVDELFRQAGASGL
jgi:hypothetical protein